MATPFIDLSCGCHDLSGDGFKDLALRFKTTKVVQDLELTHAENIGEVQLIMIGAFDNGSSFVSTPDGVVITPSVSHGPNMRGKPQGARN